MFTGEVQSHEEALEVLRGEGEELKSQGGPDDQKRVGHWVEDLAQRLDELGGAVDDRQVGVSYDSCKRMSTHWSLVEWSTQQIIYTPPPPPTT